METNGIEATITKQFRLERAPTLLALKGAGPPIAFTRLQGTGTLQGPTLSVPPEDAFAFEVTLAPLVFRRDLGRWQIQRTKRGRPRRYLSVRPQPQHDCGPRPALRLFALLSPCGDARPAGLRPRLAARRGAANDVTGTVDPVMHGLAMSLLAALQDPAKATTLFVDYVALAFHAHILTAYGGCLVAGVRAGLAPWQLRRVDEFIEAHLDGDPSIADLARECRLSESHFARAFRRTTGMTPHRWVMKRRIERAKELLLQSDLELTQIALACGFVDQSHLNRNFVRAEGHSPGKWRWLRRG